jgi:hypothetical protein
MKYTRPYSPLFSSSSLLRVCVEHFVLMRSTSLNFVPYSRNRKNVPIKTGSVFVQLFLCLKYYTFWLFQKSTVIIPEDFLLQGHINELLGCDLTSIQTNVAIHRNSVMLLWHLVWTAWHSVSTYYGSSRLSLFKKNKRRLMRSPCCLSVYPSVSVCASFLVCPFFNVPP